MLLASGVLVLCGCQKLEVPGALVEPKSSSVIESRNVVDEVQFSDTKPISMTYIHWNVIQVRLDRERMQSYRISIADIVNLLSDASELGPRPKHRKTPPEIEIITRKSLDQCNAIPVRATANGEAILIKDIAHLELMHAAL